MYGKIIINYKKKRSIEAQSKKYVVVSPHGKVIIVKNMAKFCRENNLSKSDMCELTKGKLENCKGWTALHGIENIETLAV